MLLFFSKSRVNTKRVAHRPKMFGQTSKNMTCTNKYFVENSLTFCTTMGQQPYFSVDNARDLPLSVSHITHESPSSEIFPFLQGPQSCVTSVRVFSNFLCHTKLSLNCARQMFTRNKTQCINSLFCVAPSPETRYLSELSSQICHDPPLDAK